MYMYDWVTLLYSINWHKIVNQLYFNKKYFKTALDVVCVLMVQTLEKLT